MLASAPTAQTPCSGCTGLKSMRSNAMRGKEFYCSSLHRISPDTAILLVEQKHAAGAQLAPQRASTRKPFTNARPVAKHRLVCSARLSAHINATKVGNSYSPVFDTEEARADLRFTELQDGTNKIIVVSAVAPGSTAEKEGVKVGQQILAISDPVNESQMLSLKNKPSKTSLKRALNMRRYPEVEMEFDADIASVAKEIIDKAGGGDVYKALQAAQVHTASQESTSEKRNQDKEAFMSKQTNSNSATSQETKRSAGKNKNTFALVSAIGFFIIPLAFVAIAIWSGYLDSLQG